MASLGLHDAKSWHLVLVIGKGSKQQMRDRWYESRALAGEGIHDLPCGVSCLPAHRLCNVDVARSAMNGN